VGLADDDTGAMGVPDNFIDVGWYKHGPRPGMVGSAVIAGHYNGKNLPKAVFYDLSELDINDTVEVVDENGISFIFQVVKVRTYAYNEPTEEVFVSNDGKVRLNLITCGGSWLKNEKLYDQRTVVFTELVI
jgi:sortase (surface protein transpeptidase)